MRTRFAGLAWFAGAMVMSLGTMARPAAAQQAAPPSPEITVYKSPT